MGPASTSPPQHTLLGARPAHRQTSILPGPDLHSQAGDPVPRPSDPQPASQPTNRLSKSRGLPPAATSYGGAPEAPTHWRTGASPAQDPRSPLRSCALLSLPSHLPVAGRSPGWALRTGGALCPEDPPGAKIPTSGQAGTCLWREEPMIGRAGPRWPGFPSGRAIQGTGRGGCRLPARVAPGSSPSARLSALCWLPGREEGPSPPSGPA